MKIGIVGFGNMGTAHCRGLRAGKAKEVELAAIADISPARREAAKKEFPDIPVFESAKQMFESGVIEAVEIAVPHYDHSSIAIDAFAHHIHV
ncbi:MAG: Gfo/Idh/MocA family oxidoreductase, partial [Ruthenibacterium sp.]